MSLAAMTSKQKSKHRSGDKIWYILGRRYSRRNLPLQRALRDSLGWVVVVLLRGWLGYRAAACCFSLEEHVCVCVCARRCKGVGCRAHARTHAPTAPHFARSRAFCYCIARTAVYAAAGLVRLGNFKFD